jgi:hypothetical protein
MSMTPTHASEAARLDYVRWQIRSLFSARCLGPWTAVEQADYDALTIEELLLLDVL